MAIFEVVGGKRLSGEIELSGAKNAALPILFGSLLSDGVVDLRNVPTGMEDIKVAIQVIRRLGADVKVSGNSVTIDSSTIKEPVIPYELASRIRYSLLLLGVFLARFGKVELPFPGGCDIGTRKFDLHIKGLRDLGAEIEVGKDSITGSVSSFRGADVEFYLPTTSGTENVMLAACLARGKTSIRNANTRPEIMDFAHFLEGMGARIKMSNRLIEINGVKNLKGTSHRIMSGGDEAMSYMLAAGITGGEVMIRDYDLSYLRVDTQYLREAGLEVFEWGGSVYVSGRKGLRPFHIFTAPYPGVNSDLQPLFAALALGAPGESTITDQRFTDRFDYVDQLKAFGGNIDHYGNCAVIRGGKKLKGASVRATDLRGGVSEILAGMISEGKTVIDNIYQIDRGYERIERKLSALGADIKRKKQAK
ncbi:MAG: UDP-N-acetylglucosamine 1-carboxyvinyltransferase [Candidatus Krumholzibacteriota bacterium]|nr:UDP-N-acetylglucosamine 1-carboxyvinyltransferase [Candidatus Krumholzibacteriota bacterium]